MKFYEKAALGVIGAGMLVFFAMIAHPLVAYFTGWFLGKIFIGEWIVAGLNTMFAFHEFEPDELKYIAAMLGFISPHLRTTTEVKERS